MKRACLLALTLAATFPRAAAPTVTIDASAPADNVNPALFEPVTKPAG